MERNHYRYLDALRGIAIFLVLLVHVWNVAKPDNALLDFLGAHGARGVQLFYMASALTLLMSWENRRQREHAPVRNFFLRRFFRIAPLYWLAVLIYAVAAAFGVSGHDAPVTWHSILANLTFTHGWHPDWIASPVPIGWSVGVEVSFYALLPLLVLFITNIERAVVAFLVSLPLAGWLAPFAIKAFPNTDSHVLHTFLYFWLPNQLPVFLLGIVAFYALPLIYEWSRKNTTDRAMVLFGLAGVVLAFASTGKGTHVTYSLGFLLLILALSIWQPVVLVNRFTCFLGKISYSVYLLHFVLLVGVQHLVTKDLPFTLSNDATFLLILALLTVYCLAICYASYRWIEEPCMAFGKKVIARFETRPTVQHSPADSPSRLATVRR